MTEWFFVSAWLEKNDQEIHFEIANEDGDQYFFWLEVSLVNTKLASSGGNALDRFYYAEEDMLALAVTILDEELLQQDNDIYISAALFDRYF